MIPEGAASTGDRGATGLPEAEAETRGKRDGNTWQNSAKEPSGSDWEPEFPTGLAGRCLGRAQCSHAGEVAVPHIPLGA